MESKINIEDFEYILMYGRWNAQDLCIEFSLGAKTMLMPAYRLN